LTAHVWSAKRNGRAAARGRDHGVDLGAQRLRDSAAAAVLVELAVERIEVREDDVVDDERAHLSVRGK